MREAFQMYMKLFNRPGSPFQPDRDGRRSAVSHGGSAEAGGGAEGVAVGALEERTRRNSPRPIGSERLLRLRPAPGHVSPHTSSCLY